MRVTKTANPVSRVIKTDSFVENLIPDIPKVKIQLNRTQARRRHIMHG